MKHSVMDGREINFNLLGLKAKLAKFCRRTLEKFHIYRDRIANNYELPMGCVTVVATPTATPLVEKRQSAYANVAGSLNPPFSKMASISGSGKGSNLKLIINVARRWKL